MTSSGGSLLGVYIDIIVVLAVVYVTLSCVCSWVNEQIASFLHLRGGKLYAGVLNLLVGHAGYADAVFASPFVASSSDDKGGAIIAGKKYRPSYIAPRNFSLAFWQTVRDDATLLAGATPVLVGAPAALFADLSARVVALSNIPLQRALASLLNEAQGDYEALLRATDAWFNAQMDRVSGWYLRQTQFALLVIGIVVVLFSGVDSIEIGKRLYIDPELRTAVADAVAQHLPAASGGTAATPPAHATSAADPEMVRLARDEVQNGAFSRFVHPYFSIVPELPEHLWGLLVTLAALQLGAPFWFDALKTLVNVRASGSSPPVTKP